MKAEEVSHSGGAGVRKIAAVISAICAWVQRQRALGGDRERVMFRDVWEQVDLVEGKLAPNQEQCLFTLASKLPSDGLILEVGSFTGRSTVSMAFACRDTARRIVAVDTFSGNSIDFIQGKTATWEGDNFYGKFMRNLGERGLDRYVIPLRGFSHEVARFWASPIDMLFLDGSHDYNDVLLDVRNFMPWVRPGGCVALHDVTKNWPSVQRVWQEEVGPQLERCGNVGSLSFGYKPLHSSEIDV